MKLCRLTQWSASVVLLQETVTAHCAYVWLYVPAGHLIRPTNWYLYVPVCSGAMKPQLADIFELPVVVYFPPDATVIGPVDWAPSGKVMIMFTVPGNPEADTVQF